MTRALLVSAVMAAVALAGCATTPAIEVSPATLNRLTTLLPADAILLGEQHDAPDHQRVQREVLAALAARGALGALALEMAEQGSATAGLARSASEDQVKAALRWDNAGWPWPVYGPAVMAAVRAGVPVLGANLPHDQMRAAMTSSKFDMLLSGPALKAQQQLIRLGHCGMLPERQITPMTRIQIARDVAMAQTVAGAAVPGKTVLLLAGSGHVDRNLGVPQHLPAGFKAKAVRLIAEQAQGAVENTAGFDLAWPALAAPEKDYCAKFRARPAD